MMLSSVLLVLLHLCSLQHLVVSRPTCHMDGVLVIGAHNLLRDMGGDFPVHCLQYNANISFPDCLPAATANHSQCRQALSMVKESVKRAGHIFVTEREPVQGVGLNWDSKKVEVFRQHQDRLLRETNCPSGANGSGVLSPYFTNVTALLRQPESSACGWMALRRDMLKFLKSALDSQRHCFIWRSNRRG